MTEYTRLASCIPEQISFLSGSISTSQSKTLQSSWADPITELSARREWFDDRLRVGEPFFRRVGVTVVIRRSQ